MNKKKPLVSIIIPVYNREKIIGEAINSVLEQSYQNFEIIIGDNCSTDNTYDIIKEYSIKDNRIKIFKNKKNLGPVKNWIECIKKAKGKYSKILWSDDLIGKNFILKSIEIFDKNTAFVFSNISYFKNIKDIIKNERINNTINIINSNDYIYDSIFYTNFTSSPGSAIFRTKDLKNNLLLEIPNNEKLTFNNFGAGNDLLIFLLTGFKYKHVKHILNVENYFRAHKGSITCSSKGDILNLYYTWAMLYFIKKENFNYKGSKSKFKTKLLIRKLSDKRFINIYKSFSYNINIIYFIFRISYLLLKIVKNFFYNLKLKIKGKYIKL